MNGSVHRTRSHGAFEAQLPAELESAVVARRLVATAVSAWKLGEAVRHDAVLAVSELVTNSVLHAGTPVHVAVKRLGPGIRIEVEDGNPHLPLLEAPRPEELFSNRSMTGRGLALVAAASDQWGTHPHADGKVTWVDVGTGGRRGNGHKPPGRSRPVETREGKKVHLVGVPVSVLLESTRQLSDLQREVQVMAMGHNAPPELEQVVATGKPWMGDIDMWTDADRRTAESAAAVGAEKVDFDVFVPDDIASTIEGIAAWLKRAATSLMRRQLLTLPPTEEVVAYRRWFRDEIFRQLAGRRPRPCPIRVPAARGS